MPELPSYPDTSDDSSGGSSHASTTGNPRWVPVVGVIIAIVLVLAFVVLHLVGVVGPTGH